MKKFVAYLFCFFLLFCLPAFGQGDREKTGTGTTGSGGTTSGSSGSGGAPENGAALILRVSNLDGLDGNPIARGTGRTLFGCSFSNSGFPRPIKIKRVVVCDFAFLPSQQTASPAFSPVSFTLGGTEVIATTSVVTKLGRQYTFDFDAANIIANPSQPRSGTLFAAVPTPIPTGQRGVAHQFFLQSVEAESAINNPSYNPVRVLFLSEPLQGPKVTIVDTTTLVTFGRSGIEFNRVMSDNDLLAITSISGDGDIPAISEIRIATITFSITLANPSLINNVRLVLPNNSEITGAPVITGDQLRVTFQLPTPGTSVPPFVFSDFKLKINSSGLAGVEMFTRLEFVDFFDGPTSDIGASLATFVAPTDFVFRVVYTSTTGPQKF